MKFSQRKCSLEWNTSKLFVTLTTKVIGYCCCFWGQNNTWIEERDRERFRFGSEGTQEWNCFNFIIASIIGNFSFILQMQFRYFWGVNRLHRCHQIPIIPFIRDETCKIFMFSFYRFSLLRLIQIETNGFILAIESVVTFNNCCFNMKNAEKMSSDFLHSLESD